MSHVESLAVEGGPQLPRPSRSHPTALIARPLRLNGSDRPSRFGSPLPYFIAPVSRLSPPLLLLPSSSCQPPPASREAARPSVRGESSCRAALRLPLVLPEVRVHTCFSFASGGRGDERKLGSWMAVCVRSWTGLLGAAVWALVCARVRIAFLLLFCVGFGFLSCDSLGSPVGWSNSGRRLAESEIVFRLVAS